MKPGYPTSDTGYPRSVYPAARGSPAAHEPVAKDGLRRRRLRYVRLRCRGSQDTPRYAVRDTVSSADIRLPNRVAASTSVGLTKLVQKTCDYEPR